MNLLEAEYVQECICQHCLTAEAIVRCRDCLRRQYLCTLCDGDVHQHLPLHNRESMFHGFFKPLCPTTAVKRHSETFEFSEQGMLFMCPIIIFRLNILNGCSLVKK